MVSIIDYGSLNICVTVFLVCQHMFEQNCLTLKYLTTVQISGHFVALFALYVICK